MTDLSVGLVLEWMSNGDEETRLARVLWIDPPRNLVVLFDLRDVNALPEWMNIDEVLALLKSNDLRVVTFMTEKNLIQENFIQETYRRRRDTAWDVIKDLVKDEPAIYDERSRGPMIRDVVGNKGVSRQQIYTWLRRYWREGKTVNALLPNYDHCGGSRASSSESTKVGRTSLRARANPELRGIPITKEIESVFQVAINKWYHSLEGLPLTKVFNKMLGRFFNSGYMEKDGETVPILLPAQERPTIRQFRYWHEKTRDKERELRTRYGDTTYEQNFRPVLGTTNHEALGPGLVFQIDATIADVWLVHRLNRSWLIGKPVLYFVVDLFSRLITGMYVGLEGPSWLGAMMALENAASDKVEYCAAHGIKIAPEQWPAHHLPEILTSDRGEFEGTKPTHLIQTLHTDVQTLPPYRPDWKPIVERSFRLSNDETIRWLPGSVPERANERGSRNYKLDAIFDIEEFEQVMIRMVLKYNNYHVLSKYQRTKNMIRDDVPPIPIHLWNWGRQKEYNGLHTFPKDILRLNLLPMEKALITRQGIRFHNRFYVSQTALKEQWFVGRAKTRSLDVHYDPRDNDVIYIRKENGRGYEICNLTDIYSRYRGLRDEEARDIDSYENAVQRVDLADDEAQASVELDTHIDSIIEKAANKRRDIPKNAMSKENVREHRNKEKNSEREQRVWRLEDEEASPTGKVLSFKKGELSTAGNEEADYSELIEELLDLGGEAET